MITPEQGNGLRGQRVGTMPCYLVAQIDSGCSQADGCITGSVATA